MPKKQIRKTTKRNIVKLETYDNTFNAFNLIANIMSVIVLLSVTIIVLSYMAPYFYKTPTIETTTAVTPEFVDTNDVNQSFDFNVMWIFLPIILILMSGIILVGGIVYNDEIKAFLKKYNPFYIKDGNIHIRR